MPRGGARPGAGRKKGSLSKGPSKAAKVMALARQSGELPHEFMLRVSRGEKIGDHEVTFAEQYAGAKDAAPYYAPKLASVDHQIFNGDLSLLSEDELLELKRIRQKLADGRGDRDGAQAATGGEEPVVH